MTYLFLKIVVLCYSVSFLGCLVMLRKSPFSCSFSFKLLHFLFVWVGLFAHGYLLYQWMHDVDGLNFNLVLVFSLISWLVALLMLLPQLRPVVERALLQCGVFVLCLASVLVAVFFPLAPVIIAPKLPQIVHITLALLAYSFLCFAGLQAILLSLQNRALKTRPFSSLLNVLPSIEAMESILIRLLWVGTALLTVGIATGLVFTKSIVEQHLVHKTFFSTVAWVVFAAFLWGHQHYGWRSQTAVRWTLGGLTFLVLGYFGSKFVLEILLV